MSTFLKKLSFFGLAIFTSIGLFAQYPSGQHNETLRTWLKANLYDGYHSNLGYNLARQEMYSYTDESGGQIECIYSGFKQAAAFTTFPNPINAEHLVPQSFFGSVDPMRSDIHVLRPSHGDVNTARGVLPFGEVNNATATWYGLNGQGGYMFTSIEPNPNAAFSEGANDTFEPREDKKGDIARQLFYFYTMYPTQAGSMNLVADVNVLYAWHLQDPVSVLEMQRNDRIEEVQGNRNPYIDYADLAYDAWLYQVTCPMPDLLTASSISEHEAIISWNETGSATLWKLEYGLTGFQQGMQQGTMVSVLNPSYFIQGLSSDTSYDFYVQSNCNPPSGDSDWSGPFTFKTLPDFCAGDIFTDSGTSLFNYSNNEDEIYVLCPDVPSNGGVTLTFNSVDIAVSETGLGTAGGCWDYLTIYNGADTNAVILAATLCGELETDGQSPFIPSSLLQAGDSFVSTDASSCLTVRFRSDDVITEGGWTATLTCPEEETCLAPSDLDVIEIGFGGSNPRVNATWNNNEGTSSCEVRGGRISDSTAGTSSPQFSNINNTQVISQTNGTTVNFNIALYNNPTVPFVVGKTYGYEVRCACADASGFSAWSGIFPSSTFVVPSPPVQQIQGSSEAKLIDRSSQFKVYPNPNEGNIIQVEWDNTLAGMGRVEIRDVIGRLIQSDHINMSSENKTIAFRFENKLKAGWYTFQVITDGNMSSERFLVK